MKFAAGQRWFSQTEPELGLGIIESLQQRRVQIQFPAAEETRVYAEQRAPLQRHTLQVGQQLTAADGLSGEIIKIQDNQGVLIYLVTDPDGAEQIVPEMFLAHELRLDAADKRLLSGQVNHLHWYQLRHRLREQYAQYETAPVRGLIGGRIQLTPHQYYIADVATRHGMPRILLSDEVGLGKTMEAGLILHKLETEGRARRTLISVPDALLHQWLVEMIRKFDKHFSVFDTSRLQASLEDDPDTNPFDTEQRILTPASLWEQPAALEAASQVDWDLLIVDEAHHLDWHPEQPGPAFTAIAQLSARAPGVLLLTATPEQDGSASHFARLQLLDPARFHDYDAYLAQEKTLRQLSSDLGHFIDKNIDKGTDQDTASSSLDAWCQDAYSQSLLAEAQMASEESDIQTLVDYLIDIHGTGRVQFRNTRDRIQGFPDRQVTAHPLSGPNEYAIDEPYPELKVPGWTETDPRVDWLAALLRDSDRKVVMICHHQATARGLEGHLRLREGLSTAQFHEDMDLVERDRAAAYFADSEDGAQALICSEIGSEGRNFQFAHTLVCFDLPPHPDLLEQRIGRLDRIGQTQTIDIHVPYFTDHVSEHWFRWYHEGLDAFNHTCAIGAAVLKQTLHTLPAPHSLLDLPIEDPVDFEAQLEATRVLAEQLSAELKAGKHRLLEWHSFNRDAANELVEMVSAFETQASPEAVILEALESLGLEIEDEGQGIFGIQPGNKMIPDSFPFVSDEGGRITFRRNIAMSRDDVRFITWEHPLVQFVLETLDSTHLGAAGVTLISLPNLPKGTLYLEANFLPLMQHPARYRASQYLPQALYRKIVAQTGQDVTAAFADTDWRDLEQRLDKSTLLEIIKSQQTLIQTMVEQVRALAEPELKSLVAEADSAATAEFHEEAARLEALAERSGLDVTPRHALLSQDYEAVSDALRHAELHMDNVRLIVNY